MTTETERAPSAPSMDLIGQVARSVRLQGVRCRRFSVALLADDGSALSLRPTVTHESKYRITRDGQLVVRIDAKLHGDYSIADKTIDIVDVEVSFDLTYSVREGAELPQDALDAFASVNGLYNAWPYIREAFQAATVRVGITPFVLELLTIGAAVQKADKSAVSAGEQ